MAAVTIQMARSMKASGLMASLKDQELSHGQMGGSTMANGTQASQQELAGKFIQMAWPKRASGIMACLLKTVSNPLLTLQAEEAVHKDSTRVMTDLGGRYSNRTGH